MMEQNEEIQVSSNQICIKGENEEGVEDASFLWDNTTFGDGWDDQWDCSTQSYNQRRLSRAEKLTRSARALQTKFSYPFRKLREMFRRKKDTQLNDILWDLLEMNANLLEMERHKHYTFDTG